MTSLVLTGFMATGKTTVGRLLARRYGLRFIDTDREVERRAGCTVAEIFERDGETAFRTLESDAFRVALSIPEAIVATGGGTLVRPENVSLLTDAHDVVCLSCSPSAVRKRVGTSPNRPLLNSAGAVGLEALLEAREAAYGRFPQIDTTSMSSEQVADAIAASRLLHYAASFRMGEPQESTIMFAEGLVDSLGGEMRKQELQGTVLLLTDSIVGNLDSFTRLQSSLQRAGLTVHTHAIPAGEEHKTLDTMGSVYSSALNAGLDRTSIVLGFGGGVVCDMAGFLAATYLRGVPLVLVPTSLLAQVDASVGGKTGVDFAGTKNLIGAFHPARIVALDPGVLSTLSPALAADGLAEVVKIGMVRSADLVQHLATVDPSHMANYAHIIRAAVACKAQVVQEDPHEQSTRMLLNFGHTIGHGLEAASEYSLSHGSAVSIGMVAETRIAIERGWSKPTVLDSLIALLKRFQLPIDLPGLRPDHLMMHIRRDKKRRDTTLRLAVPAEIGQGRIVEVPVDEVEIMLETLMRVPA